MFILLHILLTLLYLAGKQSATAEGVTIQRSPGSNRINVRLQVPNPAEGIVFQALLPEGQCLTDEPTDNRLFLDLPGCRISLDWSNTLFGTSSYFRKGAKPARRVRRKWRVGPVQKLKMGSAIIHYGNDMRVQLNDTGITVASVAPNGVLQGPQQTKAVKCPLGLASSGGLLDVDIFSPPGMAKCQIGVQFGADYKLVSSAERPAAEEDVLEQEAMHD